MIKKFIFSFIILLFACSDEKVLTYPSTILPNKDGNTWNYNQTDFTSYDTISSNSQSKIMGETIFSGIMYFNKIDSSRTGLRTEYLIYMIDGLYYYDYFSKDNSHPYLSLKYPCKKNDIFSNSNQYVKVISTDTNINVTAGNFKCICYYIHSVPIDVVSYEYIDTYQFYSIGKGLIQSFSYIKIPTDSIPQQKQILELVSYKIN